MTSCESVQNRGMEAAGIEPASRETQWETLQRLTETDDLVAAHFQLCDSTGSHSLSPGPLELAKLITCWPQPIRQIILTLVRSVNVLHQAISDSAEPKRTRKNVPIP